MNSSLSNFAHSVPTAGQSFGDRLTNFIQNPVVAVILVSVIVGLLMYAAVYWFKRYTSWQFPYNP